MLPFFLLCTLPVAFAVTKQTIALPAHTLGSLTEKSVECIAETGADVNILQRVFNWQYDNNETSKMFSFCLYKKTGFSNDTGHFDEGKVMAIYEKSEKKELVREAAMECNKRNGINPLETMYKIIICFYEKSPVLLEVKLD